MIDFLLNITYNKTTKNASYQVQQKVGVCMNTIITIGRQFGSAGREIGEKVAEYFGITVDELLGKEKQPTDGELSDEEKAMLDLFRQAGDDARRLALLALEHGEQH